MSAKAVSELESDTPDVGKRPKMVVKVCAGTGCVAMGSLEVARKFREEIERIKDEVDVEVQETSCLESCDVGITGCHGFCAAGPLVKISPLGIMYCRVKVKHVARIVEETIRDGQIVERFLYKDPVAGERYKGEDDIPFFSKQVRNALRGCGDIDPENIAEYEAEGGYEALKMAVGGTERSDVIERMKLSGLQGRGGGGFPTGLKWQFVSEASGDEKYVVCNGDEGDPGAFMDRSVMEGDPHAVIEGMTIAGYAVGAHHGVIYVRAEYPLAVDRLKIALEQARARGYIGNSVAGSDFSFELSIVEGAGAFVCGEETALLYSIEGRRGMPRPRPPYPAVSGLWDKPTLINNVETYANVPVIMREGADRFSDVGTKLSKGTKTFALTGQVNNIGLVEVPMGITLREIIFEIGGGMPGEKGFKAAQTGGPSGGCIPASHLDTPIDYKTLTDLGSMMGSGGLVVMDEGTCMVKLAKFFMEFCVEESCGKCPPCRLGTKVMLNILDRICEGEGQPGDIERLEALGKHIKQSSLCGLGQTAPNPTLSTIKFFRDEYEEHIQDKHCPAGECYNLVEFYIDESECNGCELCKNNCPVDAISGEKKHVHVIDSVVCINCGSCLGVCPSDAVKTR